MDASPRSQPRRRRLLALAALIAGPVLLLGALAVWRGPGLMAGHRTAAAATPGPRSTPRAAPATPASTPSPGPRRTPAPFSERWLAGHPAPALQVRAESAILVDLGSRQVLYDRQSEVERAPASLTKLVTAMVAADLAPLDRVITVPAQADVTAVRAVEPQSTVMEPGLKAGERLSERELMYGLFLRSGNDAAEALAGGITDRATFIGLMNRKAAELGMDRSHFTTPVGLDAAGLYSTAADLAVAAGTIELRYPRLAAIAATPQVDIPQTATHQAFHLRNYNRMLIPGGPAFYLGVNGMKTAFTDDAGPCAVITAARGGRRLVAVVMHSSDFFADAKVLLDYGFAVTPTAAS